MTHSPLLSICVPSRNRQIYFQHTIDALTRSLRTDVEFVFVDNSDDPAIMDDFLAPRLADPRIRYVRSGPTVRSMVDNWETAIEAATGRWISFIGDDDYIDPDLALLIEKIEAAIVGVEAIDWNKLNYTWPYDGKRSLSNPVYLRSEVHEAPKALLMERAFRWQHARDVLGCGFGIYHGAVSRDLMQRIKSVSKTNRYFEHPVVDYDSIFKIIMHGNRFVHCRRPLSVMGVCPLSNSAAVGKSRDEEKQSKAFDKELPTPLGDMECYRSFPFDTRMGVASVIAMTQHWFETTYGYDVVELGKNFARSCVLQCEKYRDKDEFDRVTAAYRQAFSQWKGGRYLKYFTPSYRAPVQGESFCGYLDGYVYITDKDLPCETPEDFYRLATALIGNVSEIIVEPRKYTVKLSA